MGLLNLHLKKHIEYISVESSPFSKNSDGAICKQPNNAINLHQ